MKQARHAVRVDTWLCESCKQAMLRCTTSLNDDVLASLSGFILFKLHGGCLSRARSSNTLADDRYFIGHRENTRNN